MPTSVTATGSDWLSDSWHRCQRAGLRESQMPENIRLDRIALEERQAQASAMIAAVEAIALPLFNQVFAGTNSRLLLGDAEGVIIQAWGQSRFENRLTGIALESGVCWQESLKGTNAIGNALTEQQLITVMGAQHFIRKHRFISCSASPLLSPSGTLIGVLDITSEQQVHTEQTRLLVQQMVQWVENALLCQLPDASVRVDLACDSTVLNSGWQGILIANEQGQILAHNSAAERLLGAHQMLGRQLEELIGEGETGVSDVAPLIYQKHRLNTEKRPSHRTSSARQTLSPSCPLHFGDARIEQAWQQACKLIEKDIPVLVLGETGVGKGAFVKLLHQNSTRRKFPLIAVNCGALSQTLIESELFGYMPGAFTGASRQGQPGKIRQAHQGILFLDEIAEMPLSAQTRLLHVLQDKEVVPVGATQPVPVDIRVIAATHQDLAQAVAEGRFREDLYYRLNGLVLTLPALRDRQDKPMLIQALLQKHSGDPLLAICPELAHQLTCYAWPGNVRELDNLMKVAVALAEGESELTLNHVPQHQRCHFSSASLPSEEPTAGKLEAAISETMLATYEAQCGNISRTAKALGISRNTLYRRLRKIGLI
ncbi:sigma-54-dependent Fis family transcriptional regulator [Photobacterium sp. 1_MG-2023]|uniref:sigma-54-dependent Fis family transcriptional regulator n=1 Tax=Photobacterium sp. 1_MG-2023 TaxID=3062646 RepID=UPI0026E3142C|nr:sigma-54-dependent Fis family transcriptional regulator [Photobacterium sp. 1_MG-2023]MDO6707350.1 sigma-54-dependent Fis family transcriptional regulator [Photobacterium sp. 1_MG-2023]